jgi:hypothetical protein
MLLCLLADNKKKQVLWLWATDLLLLRKSRKSVPWAIGPDSAHDVDPQIFWQHFLSREHSKSLLHLFMQLVTVLAIGQCPLLPENLVKKSTLKQKNFKCSFQFSMIQCNFIADSYLVEIRLVMQLSGWPPPLWWRRLPLSLCKRVTWVNVIKITLR